MLLFAKFWQLVLYYYLLQMIVGLNNSNHKHIAT